MSKQAVALIATLLVAAGLFVAGCGGDDDGGSDGNGSASAAETTPNGATTSEGSDDGEATSEEEGGAATSKAAFIAQADEICAANTRKVIAEAGKLLRKAANFESRKFQVEVVEVALAPQLEALAEELAALSMPSGEEEQVEAILALVEERAERANEDAEAFVEEEGRRGGPLYEEGQALAKQYGLKKCLQDA